MAMVSPAASVRVTGVAAKGTSFAPSEWVTTVSPMARTVKLLEPALTRTTKGVSGVPLTFEA